MTTELIPKTETSPGWTNDAECASADPELFFSFDPHDKRLAKAYCEECPVSEACSEYAFRNNIQFGVWGGLDADERRSIRRRTMQGTRKAGTRR